MNWNRLTGIMLVEGILMSILSVCLTVSLAEGFYIPETWSGTILPAFSVCIPAVAYWSLFSINKKTSVVAIGIFIVIVFITIMILVRAGEPLEEKLLFGIIAVLTSTVLFFLSRTRIGTASLIAAGCIVICGNAFLQYGSHPALLCLYLPASVLLTMERYYRIQIRKSSTRAPSVIRQTFAGLICCFFAVCISAGLSMALIVPAQLPTHELKLIKELVRMPVLEKIGTATTIPLDDKTQYTDEMNEEKNPTSKEGEHKTKLEPSEKKQESDSSAEKKNRESPGGGEEKKLSAIRYEHLKHLWLMLPFVVGAVAVLAILLKKRHRIIRMNRFDQLDPQQSAAAYYQYFLHMLSLVHLENSPSDTVREYNNKTKKRTQILFPGKSTFSRISRDFEKIYYGGEPFTEEIRKYFQSVYHVLPAQCCKSTGKIRYIFLFFKT